MLPGTLTSVDEHYRAMQAVQAGAMLSMRRLWKSVDPDSIAASWAANSLMAVTVFTGFQRQAAERGSGYIGEALAEQGIDVDPVGDVNPEAFVGWASDGRPLSGLLFSPAATAMKRIREGFAPADALRSAQHALDTIVRTQIADTGRGAASVGVTARQRVGYVRMLNPPSCVLCIQQAGRYFRYNAGFARHPSCDCVHVPTTQAQSSDLTTDPHAYFGSLDQAQQNQLLGVRDARAVRDGADFNQVVNARRGATGFGTTTSGASRTGVRLMPDTIYRLASTREEAVSLLRRHGYIV